MNAVTTAALALSLVLAACTVDGPSSPPVETPPVVAEHPVTPEPVAVPEPAPTADPIIAGLQAQPLVATRHGECRMGCRHIDEAEVRHVLSTGAIDPDRTRTDGSCPSYAVEGTTPDGVNARVVLAGCADETRIVTVIDLDTDHDCVCE